MLLAMFSCYKFVAVAVAAGATHVANVPVETCLEITEVATVALGSVYATSQLLFVCFLCRSHILFLSCT